MNREENLKFYRLSEQEYEKMVEILDHAPSEVEWAIFSALWSEHCSYKSSKTHLKKFKTSSKRVLESMDENAGLIDIGKGEKVAFKMESHNHPSFISPFEGASTGVGGILRDVFTMGAWPVALANYLCFGSLEDQKMARLAEGVVDGISHYGNCVGVPMLTGETQLDSCYNNNILVNAMALGLFREGEHSVKSGAQGVGNLLVYVGAKTGRDGINGASMASKSFGETQEKSTVQIGDPFLGKLLIESCFEVIQKDLVVAVQDMGAAGLISSSFEMSAKKDVGFRLNLSEVPLRDETMKPHEILLSESQERMLFVCEPENLEEFKKVFEVWDLDAKVIGEITEGHQIEIFWQNEKLTDLRARDIIHGCPSQEKPYDKWVARNRLSELETETETETNLQSKNLKLQALKKQDFKSHLLDLFSHKEVLSRRWIYSQYDQRVGASTASACKETIGSLHLDSGRFLGISLGCRPYLMTFDAYEGAQDAVLMPSLKLAIKGFLPLAVTDCLNFGNPEKKEIMNEFVASVEGLAQASQSLDVPVISGNVSFYNETQEENIISTPATAVVGLREDSGFSSESESKIRSGSKVEPLKSSFFVKDNSQIFLTKIESGLVTEGYLTYLKTKSMKGRGTLKYDKKTLDLLRELSFHKNILSSRVVGAGGLAYHLLLMSFQNEIGFKIEDDFKTYDWFSENYYEVIWESDKEASLSHFQTDKFKTYKLGETQKSKKASFPECDIDLNEFKKNYLKPFLT